MISVFRRLWGRVALDVTNRGFLTAFKYYFYAVTPRDFIVFKIGAELAISSESAGPGFLLKEVSVNELDSMRRAAGARSQEFWGDSLYGFNKPYVAIVQGQLAAVTWLVLPGDWSKFMKLREGDAELNYVYVEPRFRGNRLAEKLMRFTISSARQNYGVGDVYTVVSSGNIAQFRPMICMGYVPVGVLTKFFWTNKKYSAQTKKAG